MENFVWTYDQVVDEWDKFIKSTRITSSALKAEKARNHLLKVYFPFLCDVSSLANLFKQDSVVGSASRSVLESRWKVNLPSLILPGEVFYFSSRLLPSPFFVHEFESSKKISKPFLNAFAGKDSTVLISMDLLQDKDYLKESLCYFIDSLYEKMDEPTVDMSCYLRKNEPQLFGSHKGFSYKAKEYDVDIVFAMSMMMKQLEEDGVSFFRKKQLLMENFYYTSSKESIGIEWLKDKRTKDNFIAHCNFPRIKDTSPKTLLDRAPVLLRLLDPTIGK